MEKRDVLIKFKAKIDEDGKFYDVKKQETFIIEEYGKKLDNKKYKTIMTFRPKKGLFGDKILVSRASQGEFISEQGEVELMECSAEFQKNLWRTEGKILVGFLAVSIISLIIMLFWSRRKRKI